MESKFKIIILALLLLLASSLFIIFTIQNSKLTLLREYTDTKQRLTQENEELVNKLNNLLEEKGKFEERLAAIQKDLELVSSERDEAQHKYELVNKEREELVTRLNTYQQEREDWESFEDEKKSLRERLATLPALEFNLNKLKQENKDLRQRLKQAEGRLKQGKIPSGGYTKLEEIAQTQESRVRSVDLSPIVVSPSSASSRSTALPFTLEGKILNVNREYEFIVINLGKDKGVRLGMIFEVFRDGQLLGKVEVIQLREEITACDIIHVFVPFEPGDIVKY